MVIRARIVVERVVSPFIDGETERLLQVLQTGDHREDTAGQRAIEFGVERQDRRDQRGEPVDRGHRSTVEHHGGGKRFGVERQVPAVATAGAKADCPYFVTLDDAQRLQIVQGAEQVCEPAFHGGLLIQPEGFFRVIRRAAEA